MAPSIDRRKFEEKYQELILDGDFFEDDAYYVRERPRYLKTLELVLGQVEDVKALSGQQILEVGGGQIAILLHALYGSKAVIADVNRCYGDALVRQGFEFKVCDLLRDDLPEHNRFDVVILCEVVEHLPVPPHQILRKVAGWMKPGGLLFLTTPNLYRLRNLIRLLLGMPVFDHFFIPEPGQSIGHPFEYSAEHLKWQIETAGFVDVKVSYRQLSITGASLKARLGRYLLSPLFLRRKFRDSLVATALKTTDG